MIIFNNIDIIKRVRFIIIDGVRKLATIAFQLDKNLKLALYLQLYQQIKHEIHIGNLRLSDKLPSKKRLQMHLGISQNTVEAAYEQLQAEGYIESRPRQGFYVCFNADFYYRQKDYHSAATSAIKTKCYTYDFNPNNIDTALFPFSLWKKYYRQLLSPIQSDLLLNGDKQGELLLREQIRDYLYASRGVRCQVEQIVISAGVENCLIQLMLLFNQCCQSVSYAMEQYGYVAIEHLLTRFNQSITKLPMLAENMLDNLNESKANILLITPSHQYPYAGVIPINQRHQLLTWASQSKDRFIIEDDYDSEFRYKGKPIPALQHLDSHSKVIYLGSFSKLLMPSLRMTFMVLPQPLLVQYQKICGDFNNSVPRVNQLLIANFMRSGEFEKHIYRMRTNYRKKMEKLCSLFLPYQHCIRYYGEHSGLYLLIELYTEKREISALMALAEKKNIRLYPVLNSESKKLFTLGFANLSIIQLEQGITKLLDVWGYQPHF